MSMGSTSDTLLQLGYLSLIIGIIAFFVPILVKLTKCSGQNNELNNIKSSDDVSEESEVNLSPNNDGTDRVYVALPSNDLNEAYAKGLTSVREQEDTEPETRYNFAAKKKDLHSSSLSPSGFRLTMHKIGRLYPSVIQYSLIGFLFFIVGMVLIIMAINERIGKVPEIIYNV
ncbi:hypothetical protein NEAUS04_1888 [Nematocida ausubeli]|nr:hypothetical protein NEAUS07_1890 [Nematocida ausubeli]KAI5149840.1 hypothetical protein NEAUS05_1925 [Nematocida ausubeli]KAI5164020.1 hypothetical protein NEAUS04_1888 [Nematocida ausubeli]